MYATKSDFTRLMSPGKEERGKIKPRLIAVPLDLEGNQPGLNEGRVS